MTTGDESMDVVIVDLIRCVTDEDYKYRVRRGYFEVYLAGSAVRRHRLDDLFRLQSLLLAFMSEA